MLTHEVETESTYEPTSKKKKSREALLNSFERISSFILSRYFPKISNEKNMTNRLKI